MKTIVVPVDFSSASHNALKYASQLAKDTGAALVLVHVMEKAPPVTATIWLAFDHEMVRMAIEKKLLRLCLAINRSTGVSCSYVLTRGNTVRVITRMASEKKAFMIVMGTRGTGLRQKLMGSVAYHVIKKAGCTVMAVPPRLKYKKIRNIVYATDCRESELKDLKELTALATIFGAGIRMVHVCHENDVPAEKLIMENFRKMVRKKITYPKLTSSLLAGSVSEALHQHINTTSPGLLVLAADRRGWLARLFGPAVTRQMIYHTKIPVMVLHVAGLRRSKN